MEAALIVIALILCIIGIAGSILPGLPGHPLNYIAMWCVQWAYHPFTTITLVFFGVATLLLMVFEYFVPVWWAKKYGATRAGIIGSIVGMLVGIVFTPIGMVFGTLAGAIIGDLIAGRSGPEAVRSGLASVIGTFVSIGIKLLLAGVMTSLIIYEVIAHFFK